LLAPPKLGEARTNALGGAACGIAFPVHLGAGVERFDLAQLLQQRPFERQHGPGPSTPAAARSALRRLAGRARYAAAEDSRAASDAAYVSGKRAVRLFSPARSFASVSRR